MRGALPADGERAVAVVGSRSAGAAGLEMARRLGGAVARAGAWVISGGAVGIDAAAHAGAIEGGGRTVVVLGGGLDHLYPAVNRGLFARAVESGGGLVAEVDDGTRAATWSFPRRNRIVAALGEATVVVRAGAGSGALLTARQAARLGQPVWVAAEVTGVEGEGLRCLAAEGAAEFRTAAELSRPCGSSRSPRSGRRRRTRRGWRGLQRPSGRRSTSSPGAPTRWRGGPGSVRVRCWRD